MTTLMDQPAAAASTLYSRGASADPDRQSAEDFYQRGVSSSQRAVTIRAVGPDGSVRRNWLASYPESRINELLTLGPGWDGHHADPITTDAVRTAIAVVAHLSTDLATHRSSSRCPTAASRSSGTPDARVSRSRLTPRATRTSS
jgi:hypothetical protein